MKAFLSAAMWAALAASGAAQVELKIEQPAKDAEGKKAPPLRQAGEVFIGNRVIINGGDFAFGGAIVAEADGETASALPDPAGSQVLDDTHGDRLHGTLEALDLSRDEIIWRRPDASAPLTIPLAQIRRWTSDQPQAPDTRPAATVKFTGGDWVAAEVTAIDGDKVQLQLLDGTRITTGRSHIEWIYLSKSGAVETYDGPTSIAGWMTQGSWTYRDGALRATSPGAVSRMFQSLPDQVEYRLLIDQGDVVNSFTLALHGRNAATRGLSRGMIQIMLRASSLNLWASIDGNFKTVQTDLTKTLGTPAERVKGPTLFRVFEDATTGRILVFINGRKAGEWTIDKVEPGKNGGGFQFQPTSWSGEAEQSISMIRVLPWDGREPAQEDERIEDSVSTRDGLLKVGKLVSWDGSVLKLAGERGMVSVPFDQLGLLRFRRPENPAEDEAPVARVRLAGRGEFDAVALNWKDGKFQIQTNFGGEIALPPAAIAEIGFNRPPATTSSAADVLVFKNGDRLRGTLEGAEEGGSLRWQTAKASAPIGFAATHVAGVQLAPRAEEPAGGSVARFRNGDWLGGNLVTLDAEQLVFDAAETGRVTVPRAAVKALYFSTGGGPAVSAGLADHEKWERGFDMNNNPTLRKKRLEAGSPWRYFAGTFSRRRTGGDEMTIMRSGGLQLGRMFDTMAERVEFNLTLKSERFPAVFSAQLFTEPGNPGYMVHMSSVGLSLYDMNPRPPGRGISQQQFPFGKEIQQSSRERRLRFLADRGTGRLTILVDGVIAGQVTPKAADGARNLGRGIMISPLQAMDCTVSDLWVGPWNGVLPGKTPSTEDPETVTFANGDEVRGTVEIATPSMMKVASDVGPLELPPERLTMVDFGGPPVERKPGTRLHLAGQGALTITAWRVENDLMICRSENIGELRMPVKAVQEIVLTQSTSP